MEATKWKVYLMILNYIETNGGIVIYKGFQEGNIKLDQKKFNKIHES